MRPRLLYPDGGPGWVHDLFWLLIVVAVVAGVVIVVRIVLGHQQTAGAAPPRHVASQAMYELDLRYARGEIDRVEYMQRRADLMGQPPPGAPPGPGPGPAPGPGPGPHPLA